MRPLPLLLSGFSLLAVVPAVALAQYDAPVCERERTGDEGWYEEDGYLIRYARCEGCHAICRDESGRTEGWYDSCTNDFIVRGDCGYSGRHDRFWDVYDGDRYADSIERMADRGIFSGYPDGTFRPDRAVLRAELLKIVMLATEGNRDWNCRWAGGNSKPFFDVPRIVWYEQHLCAMVARGLISGYPDGTFRPENPVTVSEAAKILVMAFGLPLNRSPRDTAWWSVYTETLDDIGALPVREPGHRLTRAEIAFMIDRILRDRNGDWNDDDDDNDCVRAGCSGQLCVDKRDQGVVSICDWHPEYACFDRARCERQSGGSCGWTMTSSLDRCLRNEGRSSSSSRRSSSSSRRSDYGGYDCVRAGCSGQLCVDERDADDMVTTCEWRDEYACYDSARCERQSGGRCGWTMNWQLEQCLRDR